MKPVQIFNRQCYFSGLGLSKGRPDWFSLEKCFNNLLKTLDPELCDLHVIYDEAKGGIKNHFLNNYDARIKTISCGNEADSFLTLLDYIISLRLRDDTIIYIVEDDYLHKGGWAKVLIEGVHLIDKELSGSGYLSLYDHPDKYNSLDYKGLSSKIFTTQSCHWRTTPSTTNTYAFRHRTLKENLSIHQEYSRNVSISRDHHKFLHLGSLGQTVITPVPAYSTHCNVGYLSPCISWEFL